MRNIKQYPVTREEMFQALDRAIVFETREDCVGNIFPAALQEVKRRLENGRGVAKRSGSLWADPVWVFGLLTGLVAGMSVHFILFTLFRLY